jgi:hypothetical protein
MPLPSKEVQCSCGHVTNLQLRKLRCIKCGDFIFYDEQEKRRHRNAQIYAVAMLAGAIGILTYLFVEMIVTPLFG